MSIAGQVRKETSVKGGVTAGTTTTYNVATAFDHAINGHWGTQFATKANQATPTTDYVTGVAFPALAVSTGSVFVWCTTAGGTVKVIQGGVQDLDSSNEFEVRPQWPYIPDDVVPFGYTLVENGSTGSSWTFGSGNWTATGLVDTWYDVCGVLPNRPVED